MRQSKIGQLYIRYYAGRQQFEVWRCVSETHMQIYCASNLVYYQHNKGATVLKSCDDWSEIEEKTVDQIKAELL